MLAVPAPLAPMALEAAEQIANMMVLDPYPGYTSETFSMPCRNVLPKPRQKPHPAPPAGAAHRHSHAPGHPPNPPPACRTAPAGHRSALH